MEGAALGATDWDGTADGLPLASPVGLTLGDIVGARVPKVWRITGWYLPPSNPLLTNLS